MSKKQSSKRQVRPEAPADETAEQRRARQLKEWEERKKQKARKNRSGSAAPWLIGAGSVIALAVVGGVLALQGGSSSGSGDPTPTPDRRVAGLPVEQTVEIAADDDGQSINPRFDPPVVTGKAGDVIEFRLTNRGSVAHNLNVSGDDKEFDTRDDFSMGSLDPGEEGTMRIKIDQPGTYPFRCDLHPTQQMGNLILS